MDPHESLRDTPALTFARGGASRRVAANTSEAFTLALKLGASGIETTVHTTADGAVVVQDRSYIGSRLRRTALSSLRTDELPPEAVTLSSLLDLLGPTADLLLHVGSDETFEAVSRTLAERTMDPRQQVWLASPNLASLIEWRPRTSWRLILCFGPRKLTRGVETLAAELRSADIDGLGLFHQDWTPGQVALLNRFGRCTFGWGAEHERELANLFRCGVDAVSSEYADRLAAVAGSFEGQGPEA